MKGKNNYMIIKTLKKTPIKKETLVLAVIKI